MEDVVSGQGEISKKVKKIKEKIKDPHEVWLDWSDNLGSLSVCVRVLRLWFYFP